MNVTLYFSSIIGGNLSFGKSELALITHQKTNTIKVSQLVRFITRNETILLETLSGTEGQKTQHWQSAFAVVEWLLTGD